ncbi:MAG: hypothetical protein NXI24_14170 [bacterium]|nr:hypothetical protein [bacterium]
MQNESQKPSHAGRSLVASAKGVVLTGLLTLVLAGIMVGVSAVPPFAPAPELNPGFLSTQAILWFELAETADEVQAVLTPADPGADMRGAMDTLNLYDFPFMVAYSLYFLAMICFLRDRLRTRSPSFFASMFYFMAGLMFVPMILAGDIIENTQLLKLTRYGGGPEMAAAIGGTISEQIPFETILNLKIFTRMKWGAIFLACAHLGGSSAALLLLAPGKDRDAGAPSGIRTQIGTLVIALSFIATAILGFISIASLELRALLQWATLTMVVAWVGVLIQAGMLVFRRGD